VAGTSYQVLYSDDDLATCACRQYAYGRANWTIWTEALSPAPGVRLFKVIALVP